MNVSGIDTGDIFSSIVSDNDRMFVNGIYTQKRQAGVSNYNHIKYRHVISMILTQGFYARFIQFTFIKNITSFDFYFFGFAMQVITRNLPVEFISGLSQLYSATGALRFVREADEQPEEVNAYPA